MRDEGSIPKIVISASDVGSVSLPADMVTPPKVPQPIPLWARLVMLPLVLVLPLLAIIALVMRIALRATPARTQQAWHSYLMALLIAGSLVFFVTAVAAFSYMPSPPQAISAGLSDLDERNHFPSLPSQTQMTGVEISHELKPLVMVASPAAKRWFARGEMTSNSIGAAVLLHADPDGYLFATARHVADVSMAAAKSGQRVLLTTGSSGWAGADVVGWHRTADLALLWMPRHEGSAEFAQPLAPAEDAEPGAAIYVIGHPEGLNFTISNGIISRLVGDTVQISAPVSPGNSGGPVYDVRGNLLGVVTSKMDRTVDPNAENLSFAATSALLGRVSGWEFTGNGQQRLSKYIDALQGSKTPGKKMEKDPTG
jgi:S1-C subfamily serine protease